MRWKEDGKGESVPDRGDNVGDCEVFFPGEKVVERTVLLYGYLHTAILVCMGQLCIDLQEILFCEFGKVILVELVFIGHDDSLDAAEFQVKKEKVVRLL